MRSVLRRTRPLDIATPVEFGPLRLDPAAREVSLDGEVVDLTAREFDLLAFLAATPRRVYSRAELLDHVWDSSPEWQDPATVTVHMRRIRQKLEDDPQNPRWLKTVWGVGYRFEP
ncbi:MAG: winged helix-turn-helix domain-containing protein [Acidimicrobiia bacterium]